MLATQTKYVKAVEVESENTFFDRRGGVSWVYPDSKHASSIKHPKPPYYNDSLFVPIRIRDDPGFFDRSAGSFMVNGSRVQEVAEELNVNLVGAKSAVDTLKQYEIDVGISCVDSDLVVQTTPRSLCRTITDSEISLRQKWWAELVKKLIGSPINTLSRSLDNGGGEDLRSPTSSEFVVDLTDSERSVDSDPIPSTPKPKKPYADVTVKQPSPSLLDLPSLASLVSSSIPATTTPVKNSSFHFSSWPLSLPATSPTPSPTYTNFSFPSLNSSIQSLPILPPTLTKDEQGFYTEVASPPSAVQVPPSSRATQRQSNSVLPSFLADPPVRPRKTSKTREIIDQLRSASANDFSRPRSRGTLPIRPLSTPHQLKLDGLFSSPFLAASASDVQPQSSVISLQTTVEDFEEEGDGWIRAEMGEADSDSDVKARLRRDMVQVLGRNRPESTQGSESDANQGLADWELIAEASDSSKWSAKGSSGSPTRRKGARHRSRKSHSTSHVSTSSLSVPAPAPPASVALSPLPPPPPYLQVPAYPAYTTPYPYTSAYKPFLMPTQPHFFPVPAYPPTFFGPIMYPPATQIPPPSPVVGVQSGYDRGSTTGASGVRHSQW